MISEDGRASIIVVGSVNLDMTARAPRLPVAGETITDAVLSKYPGGKGANQALAAQRLGAHVSLLACVGADPAADEALALLREGGVNLEYCRAVEGVATGIALIAVAADGENQIVVAPGANRELRVDRQTLPKADALVCQLEVPLDALVAAASAFEGFFSINLAPARDVPAELVARAELVIVNETEAAFYGEAVHRGTGLVAITHGAAGAELYRDGARIAAAEPPTVTSIDSTGAGDAFAAALTVALVEGMPSEEALRFACAAGALATTAAGAQPSLPDRAAVETLLDSAGF